MSAGDFPRWRRVVKRVSWLLLLSACASRELPDPAPAAERFARAARAGDGDAIHEMLTSEAQTAYGREGVERLVADSRQELAELGRQLTGPEAQLETRARIVFYDGEHALLQLEDGRFRISSAAGLPAAAQTPTDALRELRRALARRSYPALIRVLSTETRSALEADLRTLVDGLEHPETLQVEVSGDAASVSVPGGHKVELKREGGIWRVQDFY